MTGLLLLLFFLSFAHGLRRRTQTSDSTLFGRTVAESTPDPNYNTTFSFDQLIDHNNPSLGTFPQRYWIDFEWYKPGGPIICITPGDTDAAGFTNGYRSNLSVVGTMASTFNGAILVWETRFFGESNPLPDLSEESFEYNTVAQSIEDLLYLAQNIVFPVPGGDNLKPNQTPWILAGVNYGGAIATWAMVAHPGVFHAGWITSGIVAAQSVWEYGDTIRQAMQPNCSADVVAAVQRIDQVLLGENDTAIAELKDSFGLGPLSTEDMAQALMPNLYDWQNVHPRTGYSMFFRWCDALEVKAGVSAPAAGWGGDHALAAWGSFWKSDYYEYWCGDLTVLECLDNSPGNPYFKSTAVNNWGRTMQWLHCKELGWSFTDPAPIGHPTITSRVIESGHDMVYCSRYFPNTFGATVTPAVDATNKKYGGRNLKVDRVVFTVGNNDPYRAIEMPLNANSARMPVLTYEGGYADEFSTVDGLVNAAVADVQNKAMKFLGTWLSEWQT
ncbi:serine carboxypeptidase S28-domain-containing protein [Mycena floridula]|nr:serine carboxypeptidase S28-domain-containing protein [Mycena floridula]